jgi:hypothetical protein
MSKNLLPRFAKLCHSWRDFGNEIDVLQTLFESYGAFFFGFPKKQIDFQNFSPSRNMGFEKIINSELATQRLMQYP